MLWIKTKQGREDGECCRTVLNGVIRIGLTELSIYLKEKEEQAMRKCGGSSMQREQQVQRP